jgi:hypothetical protein
MLKHKAAVAETVAQLLELFSELTPLVRSVVAKRLKAGG